jgi:hypothetical protein
MDRPRDMELRFTLTTFLEFTSDGSRFAVLNVYAPCDSALCGEFLDELRSLASLCSLPWLLVGHFNVTRSASEKNNHHFDTATTEALNDLIEKLVLQELPLLDRLFTWTNNREVPTLVRLDHIHLSPLERVVVQLDAAFARPQHLRSRAAVGGGHFSCSGLLVFSVRKFWATSLDYRALVEYDWARPSNQIAARGRRPSRKLKWSAQSRRNGPGPGSSPVRLFRTAGMLFPS